MLRISSLTPSSMAIAASVAIHVGAVAVGLGHAPHASGIDRNTGSVDIEFVAAPEHDAVPPQAVTAVPLSAAAPLPSPPRARIHSLAHALPGRPSASNAGSAATTDAVARFDLTVPSNAAPARFVLVANSAFESHGSAGQSAGVAGSSTEETLSVAQVTAPARLLTSTPVIYPGAARAAEIETSVPIDIVVDAHGRVVEARPLVAAGYGLDDAALRAVRAYRFSPAQRAGRAVRVRMRWDVLFRLR